MRDAVGRTVTHHVTYELHLPDGRVLRTRVSHPVDRSDYGANLWGHILRDQLEVDEAAFWACVHKGVLPSRGVPTPPAATLPANLVYTLIHKAGLPEAEVAAMSRDEVVARAQRFWAEGR
ncbi:hypothetical protein JOD54_000426 [Actinokineospora baliensis]|uniref:cytotoxic translational repressor of toxin-antitoxin stability system n=1 Tax=Actinokineospora baliensis TaxID=547056 RepID=UPI0027DB268C|nr:cytotoxic translational repressor of toxin-antitoxin stability system [Actinokineospora baliensis]MBM7770222.1 hypothetical protein [Actinokineospora baliensis]